MATFARRTGFEVVVYPGEPGRGSVSGSSPLLTDSSIVGVAVVAVGAGGFRGYVGCREHTGSNVAEVRRAGFQEIDGPITVQTGCGIACWKVAMAHGAVGRG